MPRGKRKKRNRTSVVPGTVATNRRARFEYEILDEFEAGLVLQGSEIKSIREGKIDISSAYARVRDGEAWLVGAHIAPYHSAGVWGQHDPLRDRKLLLNRREIAFLESKVEQERLTIVVLRIYMARGVAKAAIAVARGKRHQDRRATIRKREEERDIARAVRRAVH